MPKVITFTNVQSIPSIPPEAAPLHRDAHNLTRNSTRETERDQVAGWLACVQILSFSKSPAFEPGLSVCGCVLKQVLDLPVPGSVSKGKWAGTPSKAISWQSINIYVQELCRLNLCPTHTNTRTYTHTILVYIKSQHTCYHRWCAKWLIYRTWSSAFSNTVPWPRQWDVFVKPTRQQFEVIRQVLYSVSLITLHPY